MKTENDYKMKNLITIILIIFALNACNSTSNKKGNEKSASSKKVILTAAGATFPMPYYNMFFKAYTSETGTLLTYGGIGSGGGIRSLTDKVVDFGATDAFLNDEKLAKMPAEVVHIPTVLGAVVIAYNLTGVDNLKLSNILLEKIFMGEITKWNDPAIKSNNAGVSLPDIDITFIHRSDGSGTTYIFSDYMTKISAKWADKVGKGKSLLWPVGMGAKGNPGVAGTIKQTEGAIGYIGSEYAFAQKIQTAKVQNSSGNYIEPSIESVSAAAQGEIPADTRITLTNSADPNSYPISGFTWIILYKNQSYDGRTKEQALATVTFLDWLVSEKAQSQAEKVHYAPLPANTAEKAKTILRSVTFDGAALLE